MRLSLPWQSEPPPPVEAARFQHPSRALEPIIRRLEGSLRCGILDLGAPVAANFELYTRHRARITFADVYRFKPAGTSAENVEFAGALPGTSERFDVILAWDLLNYLSLEEISRLGHALSFRSAPGALFLALVVCPGSMPATPSRYTIVDAKSLLYEESGSPETASPAYSENTLLRSFPGFTLESRFQLRHGMVEYLFVHR